MKDIVAKLVPTLRNLYLNSLSVNKDTHAAILKKLMEDAADLEELVIINESPVEQYEVNFPNTKLKEVFIDRLTGNYVPLTAWLEKNTKLEYFEMKYPYRAVEPHAPAPFNLSFLEKLEWLNISGVFSEINLEKLPCLKKLRIRLSAAKFKVITCKGMTLDLGRLRI